MLVPLTQRPIIWAVVCTTYHLGSTCNNGDSFSPFSSMRSREEVDEVGDSLAGAPDTDPDTVWFARLRPTARYVSKSCSIQTVQPTTCAYNFYYSPGPTDDQTMLPHALSFNERRRGDTLVRKYSENSATPTSPTNEAAALRSRRLDLLRR